MWRSTITATQTRQTLLGQPFISSRWLARVIAPTGKEASEKPKRKATKSQSEGAEPKNSIEAVASRLDVPKLDDAYAAGTKDSQKCTLIVTEGDSAKALAVAGLSVIGREHFGVFPLRGKVLNVREARKTQIENNIELQAISKILGISTENKNVDMSKLRYGHLMIMADQDDDGAHIKGLVINMIQQLWPPLLQIPNFLQEFVTPLIKVRRRNDEISFFSMAAFQQWYAEQPNKSAWSIKYYKGLGTSTPQEAKQYFLDMSKHSFSFKYSEKQDDDTLDLAFNPRRTHDRKSWLLSFKPDSWLERGPEQLRKGIQVTSFINNDFIKFAMADNFRSIPSMVDGLKPSQRKVLFACLKRNLKTELKVSQLAGYVAQVSAYHHGEASLNDVIINMAQDFVCSNNVNLLDPSGQFGTRLQNGKDSASARYVFTKLSPVTFVLFPKADEQLLSYEEEEGLIIEPKYYIPIIPMVLVNGTEGIGTGYSTTIPTFNPDDIIANIRRKMRGEKMEEMTPWIRGFQGVIEKIDDGYSVSGKVVKKDETKLIVQELPLRRSIEMYKQQLQQLIQEGLIEDFREYHTDREIDFHITLTPQQMDEATKQTFLTYLKLESTLRISNMNLFNEHGKIQKYSSPLEVIDEFYPLRLSLYKRRIQAQIAELQLELQRSETRIRFVNAVTDNSLSVFARDRASVVADVQKLLQSSANGGLTADALLTMPLSTFTRERMAELATEKQSIQNQLESLKKQTPEQLWEEELRNFSVVWAKQVTDTGKRKKEKDPSN